MWLSVSLGAIDAILDKLTGEADLSTACLYDCDAVPGSILREASSSWCSTFPEDALDGVPGSIPAAWGGRRAAVSRWNSTLHAWGACEVWAKGFAVASDTLGVGKARF